MRKKYVFRLLVILSLALFLNGCSKEKVGKKEVTAEGSGLTYTFKLPKSWKYQEKYTDSYGSQAVFGAEDTRSNSGMFVLIFPKNSIDEKGFGGRTQKELAERNHYKKMEAIYKKEYQINDSKAYKFTFQTTVNQQKMWAHFYCIFTKNGVIQLMYYSAADANYEKRVESIDAALETVKETAFDKTAAASKEEESEKRDSINLTTQQSKIELTGVTRLDGEGDKQLMSIRYNFTNVGNTPVKPNSWQTSLIVKQEGKELKPGNLPADTTSFEAKEQVAAGKKELGQNETVESILLYELEGDSDAEISFSEGIVSEQPTYTLLVPLK